MKTVHRPIVDRILRIVRGFRDKGLIRPVGVRLVPESGSDPKHGLGKYVATMGFPEDDR